jgi:dephospho-CoA kinase
MKVIGLTGSIGMGKSTTARLARSLKIPVHDADKTVHNLMQPKGLAFHAIAKAFPESIVQGFIDRKKLGEIIFNDEEKKDCLETIIHPLVRQLSKKFIQQCERHHQSICILDIPLLFETARDKDMDYVVVVTAPATVQKHRVMARQGMTEKRFKAIVKSQTPDYRKRIKADKVIITARGKRHTLGALRKLKQELIS